jgi:predicted small secreted protein
MISRALFVLAIAPALTLAGCKTKEGFGKGLSTPGDKIE